MNVIPSLQQKLKPSDKTERCGLILKDGTIVEVPNIANDPVIGFYMDPERVLPYLTAGEIEGTWHTHPDSLPVLSADDMENFLTWPDLTHFIVGRVKKGTAVRQYRIERGAVVECD